MIKKIPHQSTGRGPADFGMAISIASDLHGHVPAPRAPEVVRSPVPELMGLRTSAARPHRRKVPLRRLNTMRGLATLGA
ncbi:hypothetical protein [Streptomyces sp. NPDC096012]|uniref:hypothetical protein n=1 Tax=Streptomyces sp. NPDC096012 TaxID=3155684 RepID=UPI00336A52B8